MHDLHEADRILKLILKNAEENKLKKITKAVIELGSVVEHGDLILGQNLKFNLKLLAKNTIASDMKIIIKKTKNNHWVLQEIEGESVL